MVVNLMANLRALLRRIEFPWPRAGVLFAGLASLPTQSGSISLLPPSEQLRAIEGTQREPLWRDIEPMPYGNFLPPTGGLAPALTSGFSWNLLGLAEAQGSDSIITASLNSAVADAAGLFGVASAAAGPLTTGTTPTLAGAQTVCEQLPQQLQTFTEYWNNHSVSGPPVSLAANLPTDPVRGASGDPANLAWPGPPGAWCPPSTLPFAPDSSPLANRAFWTPIAFLLSGLLVFWLSRGFKLPH
jgi:hypothetical protein